MYTHTYIHTYIHTYQPSATWPPACYYNCNTDDDETMTLRAMLTAAVAMLTSRRPWPRWRAPKSRRPRPLRRVQTYGAVCFEALKATLRWGPCE